MSELFPFEYVGGGYFRRKGVQRGVVAETYHGMEAIEYINNKARAQVEALAALVREVMDLHADPFGGRSYNGCDTDLCQWCENAKAAIKGIDTGGRVWVRSRAALAGRSARQHIDHGRMARMPA